MPRLAFTIDAAVSLELSPAPPRPSPTRRAETIVDRRVAAENRYRAEQDGKDAAALADLQDRWHGHRDVRFAVGGEDAVPLPGAVSACESPSAPPPSSPHDHFSPGPSVYDLLASRSSSAGGDSLCADVPPNPPMCAELERSTAARRSSPWRSPPQTNAAATECSLAAATLAPLFRPVCATKSA
eukprot:CAMPEP_0174854202 /NCGR_PEP_ID=MMETSP1114-20130205/30357_1 /TAXON_ID=312471 /ORGANISM="Neobodo designis, Strain CCAP 1951/1" /LENGTH=183 /DNA_ID=CAMNT_0016088883 /DNA_START=85 /DNA_END=639 /DNA_ORIENTATION=+